MGLWNLIFGRLRGARAQLAASVRRKRVAEQAGVAAAAVCLLFGGCGPRADRGEGVQLIPSTIEVQPTTTFEVRFDEPMVTAAKVGDTNAVSPLEITPKLRGRFAWRSSRSGSFAPEEPLELGAVYRFTLRAGLLNAEGRPAKANLQRTVQAPPFGVADKQLPASSTNASALPLIKLWFNADVKPDGIAAQTGFVNAKGLAVTARVRQGKVADTLGDWQNHPASWEAQFEEQRRKPEEALQNTATEPETSREAAVSNLLVIEPQQPLPAGPGWKLVMVKGYRSADGRYRGFSEFEAPIGDVQEFILEDAGFTHVIHQPPCLKLLFSKSIPEALTNSHPDWVTIYPRPENLKAEVAGASLYLSGSWQRDIPYTVSVRPGLMSTDGLTLRSGTSNQLSVPPVPPRIYFPAFSAEQFAGGNRQFLVQSVNVDRFNVRAKLLEAGNVIHALRGYGSYTGRPQYRPGDEDEPQNDGELYRRVDYNVVPGRTVFQEEISLAQVPDQGQETALSWDRVLGGRKTGVVFLEAERPYADYRTGKRLGAQALIQVTDLGLAWKSGADSISTYVFSQATGKPVPGARVQLVSTENDALREGATDAGGTAALAWHTNATWLLVQKDDDLHAVRLDGHNLQPWSFESIRAEYYGAGYDGGQQRAALFMDRDVYRPGESAHLKIVARELTDGGLRATLGMTGLVQCFDARSKRILETNIVLGDLGSFDLTLPLPREPRGEYQLRYESAGVSKYHSFTVADYEPAAFEVHLDAKDIYGPDEPMEISVGGRYQFGKNLERASIRWYVNAVDFEPQAEGFDAFRFRRRLADEFAPVGSTFVKGEAKLAGPSNALIRVDFPLNTEAPGPRAATFQVEITDVNQQTIGRSLQFLRDSSDFYLGIKEPVGVIGAGKPLEVEIAPIGREGKPWTRREQATLVLRRVDWESVLVQGAGNSVRYRHKAIMTNVWEKEIEVEPPVRMESGGEVTHRGTKIEGILAPGAGEYYLDVSSKDASGRAVGSSVRFHVAENTRTAWDYRNEYEIKLVPGRTVYHPGEVAEILVKTPFGGEAWVAVEREGVRRQFVASLEGNAPIVRVPIASGDSPNVFVSVTIVRGADENPHQARTPEYRVGYCMLNIEDPATQLRVEAAAGLTNYLPGAEVTVSGSVRDAGGKPVTNAEVTLYAVDEGVLSLSGYVEPDLHSVFLAHRGLGVQSGITLPFLLPEDASQLVFNNKGYLGGGGGKERLRQRFVACALWLGALRTGEDGVIRARFTAPDGLTRYRLIAIAHTASSQFGKSTSNFSVSKPLMVEPVLPRFANVSDNIQARALVLNESGKPGRITASLALDDKATSENGTNLTATLEVPAGSSAIASFPVTLAKVGEAKWTWRVAFAEDPNGYSDAVLSTLSVGSPLPLLRESAFVRLDAPATNLLSGFNPQLLEGTGEVRVRLSSTRLVLLGEPMRQLLTYPYGCAEQTASSTLPWVILRQSPELLPLVAKSAAEANAALEAGVERLLKMQTRSGGLAYWPGGSEPALWASTYGAMVLGLARGTGTVVPENQWNELLTFLSGALRISGNSPEDQCLALYALALGQKAEPAYHTKLFEKRAQLSASSRAALALAIAASGGKERMISELLLWEGRKPRAQARPFECDARTDAMWLLALMRNSSNGAETLKFFDRLMGIQENGHWGTTQGNAWSLLALSTYLRATDARSAPGKALLARGDARQAIEFTPEQRLANRVLEFGPEMARVPLMLQKEGDGPLFAQVTLESRVSGATKIAQNHGFSLERHYTKLTDENKPSTEKALRVGDRVLVTLKIAVPQHANYVAIDDPLPAVLEAINPNFKTQENAAKPGMSDWNSESGYERLPVDFQELRQDRVLFFANWVGKGTYLVQYVARVRGAGTVIAPAARIEEMYKPGRFGLSASEAMQAE